MTKITATALTAVIALTFSTSASVAASFPTPVSIEASVLQNGAKATIVSLDNAEQWDQVVEKMQGGNSSWIALAPKLAPGSDAGSAEDLGISLAFSLPKNATAVLAALDPHDGHVLGVGRVCGIPFIEDTVKDRPAYKRHAIQAVERVSIPRLVAVRAACLKVLRSSS